ncbi:M16 family metallopeptidase [Phytopseudomonas dryadis]|uniref:Insulinase family protein n=1 Tax=Phytopseudomonas dryadis TaxID=2487520 RepID=A0ABY1ZB23_9GAMM|nr:MULTISPECIES: pitrilysin family protein [Pseudomonas]TBV08667.1 insulinase family protein [Pseudomonas dryadis]TBV13898.1 insulinase family protein [Pseudomonas sp. FRB 230]
MAGTWTSRLAGLLGALLLGACASPPPPDTPLRWDERVIRGELANGLQYNLVRSDAQPRRLDLRLTVHAGSVDEDDDQVGVAHMLEHLAFYSHGGDPLDVRQRLQQAGWQQGRHYNAVTSYDRTQYLFSPPEGNVHTGLALQALADLVFAADYSAADLDRERPIVIEEWRGGLGVAQRMNAQRTAAQRTGSRYPAHRTIGNRKAIEQAQLAALQAFQQRWYRPNNMVLNIVGDFAPQQMRRQIEQVFGQAAPAALGPREQLELPLDRRLKVFRVQDSQSGSNQVALLFRFQETDRRQQDLAASRERLIDRLALAVLTRQLRHQPREEGVSSLTAVKTQIGRRSGVLALAAGVDGQHHDVALDSLLRERQRLYRHDLLAADVEAAKGEIRRIAERMLATPEPRDFDGWVRQLNDATLAERVLQDPRDIARHALANLDSIGAADLQQRIRHWLNSRDRVLQLSAPGDTPLPLPSAAAVEQRWQHWSQARLEAPQAPRAEVEAQPPELLATAPSGSIGERRTFATEGVEHWHLSNGDRLVWLRRPGLDGKAQLRVDSSAGFMHQGALPWRAQIANQLALQTPPSGWSDEQLRAWRQSEGVQLSFEQGPRRLEANGSANPAQLASLLALYQLRQTRDELDEQAYRAALDDLRERLSRQRDSVRSEQDATWRQLKQGREDWQSPTAEAIDGLQRATLEQDWRRQAAAPVTYYLMSDLPATELEPLVRRYLAGIPRAQALSSAQPERQPGRRQAVLAIALEPRASLYASSFRPRPWNPGDAARVAALREIANSHLKQRLRGEAAGVYRLKFDSELSPEYQRIDSELHFSSDPRRLDELWALARQTLASLPDHLDEATIAPLRAELARQEQRRRQDPTSQLHRLVLSERAWGDPRYLSEQRDLPAALELEAMRGLARQLFVTENRVLLRVLPQQAEAVR